MDHILVLLLEIFNGVASLALISVGLAIIFGMMRIINFAHGEFLMLGGYATIIANNAGANLWLSMLVVAPLTVGLIGLFVERFIIRFLYGRMIDTLIATWGLSLFIIGITITIFGHTLPGISAPLGSFSIGQYSVSAYRIVLIAVTFCLFLGIWLVLKYTVFGVIARGTMQNADMASALGVSAPRVYSLTFFIGSAVTGLAGGLLAPITGVLPTIGTTYVAKSFITVIGGGSSIIVGTLSASGLFGTVSQLISYVWTPVLGQAGMLLVAVIMLRLLPKGITGRYFRASV